MTATITETEVSRYVAEVAGHLGALPEDEQIELLDDLRQHLVEVAAEDDTPLELRLGPPAAYAAELLATVGVAPSRARVDRVQQAAAWWRAAQRSRAARELRRFLPELRPGWWVLRAVLGVYAAAVLLANDYERTWPVPDFHSINEGWLLLPVTAAAVVSVAVGRRTASGGAGRLVLLGNALVVVAFVLALGGMHHRQWDGGTVYETAPGLFAPDGSRITNLFPHDAEGRLLEGVLLYDQHGNPIDVHGQAEGEGFVSNLPVDANGAPITNAYPLDQTDTFQNGMPGRPGTNPPAVVIPRRAATTTEGPQPADRGGAPQS